MEDTKIQIYDDYCKDASQEEISAILDRLSTLLSESYSRSVHNEATEDKRICA